MAAELLVPAASISSEYRVDVHFPDELRRLARLYKVSTLVLIRRLFDIGAYGWDRYRHEYEAEVVRLAGIPKTSGGNFYLTQASRLSKRFARALVVSTLEGRTLQRDAYRLLGFSKLATFQELGRSLGVVA